MHIDERLAVNGFIFSEELIKFVFGISVTTSLGHADDLWITHGVCGTILMLVDIGIAHVHELEVAAFMSRFREFDSEHLDLVRGARVVRRQTKTYVLIEHVSTPDIDVANHVVEHTDQFVGLLKVPHHAMQESARHDGSKQGLKGYASELAVLAGRLMIEVKDLEVVGR